MKPLITVLLSAALLAGSAFPAQSQSVLGGIIGKSGDRSLVTIGSGNGGSSGLINLGVGGDNVLDAKVGNGRAAGVTVGGGESGGLGVGVNLLDSVNVGVGVGGDNLVDVDIGVGGGGNNGGTPGGGGVVPVPGGGTAGSGGSGGMGIPDCAGLSNVALERLLQSTRIDGSWQRASGVILQQVALCPEQRAWLAEALPNSRVGQQLRSAIAADALLSASLSRGSIGPDRVLAVQRNGSQLTVYVY